MRSAAPPRRRVGGRAEGPVSCARLCFWCPGVSVCCFLRCGPFSVALVWVGRAVLSGGLVALVLLALTTQNRGAPFET